MSNLKFQRRYRITVKMDGGDIIIIEPPFTLQFSVERSIASSMNTGLFLIYNLSEVTRNQIFQDKFINLQRNLIIVEAGYDDLSIMFSGYITRASSVRQGPNMITTIEAMDGGFDTQNTLTSKTLADGTTLREVIESLIGDFPNLNQGAIGQQDGTFKRPVVLDGNTFDLLKRYTNNQVFVDLQKVYALNNDEAIVGDVPLINADTGLLETPRREDAYLTLTTLFEPRIIMAQVVELESETLPIYNGQYKVVGVTHQGVISEAVGGQCQSRINLLLGSRYFGRLKIVDQSEPEANT